MESETQKSHSSGESRMKKRGFTYSKVTGFTKVAGNLLQLWRLQSNFCAGNRASGLSPCLKLRIRDTVKKYETFRIERNRLNFKACVPRR